MEVISKCPVCEKKFDVLWPHLWSYKRDGKYLCTWRCLRAFDDKKEAQKFMKMSKEQREKAIEMAIDGGNPLEYLKECGAKSPSGTWYHIKKDLKAKDPDRYMELPEKYRPAEKVTAAEAVRDMKDAAEDFFGKCRDMGLKVVPDQQEEDKRKRIMVPLSHSGLRSIGWASDFGEYVYDKRHECITYTDCEGDEICYTVDRWIQFFHEFKTAAQLLGVEL